MRDSVIAPKPLLKGRGFIATGNSGKLREMIPLCHEYFQIEGEITGLAPEGAVESADSFEGNALIKARFLRDVLASQREAAPFWILADDSGLSVDDLDGRPGVHSARYAGDHVSSEEHMTKLIAELRASGHAAPHPAHYTCALALVEATSTVGPTRESVGEGECHGEIVFSPQGASGFGYDPIFWVPEFGRTFAEVSYEQKNSISHRRRAFEKLARTLMPALFLMMAGFGTPTLRAEPLSKILTLWQSEGFLSLPQIPSEALPLQAKVLDTSTLHADSKELLAFYSSKLSVTDPSKLIWKSTEIPPEYQLPAARPGLRHFNTQILQAFQGTHLVASFRAVDTTSGCESACAPITFHLLLRAGSQKPELLEDKTRPLLKKGHVPFSDEDRLFLSSKLAAIPALLKKLSSSAQTTDAKEQTWPLYTSTLVSGAAYTSYRVYEAALQLLESLNSTVSARQHDLEAANEILGRAFRITDAKDGEKIWKELVSNASTTSDSHMIQQFRSAVLAALVAWRFDEDSKATPKKLEADLKSARLDTLPDYKCRVLETLLLDHSSRARLAGARKTLFENCAGLRPEWVRILSLAPPAALDADLVSVLREELSALPDFLVRRPSLMAEVAMKLPPHEETLRSEILAQLKAQHPRFVLDATLVDSARVKLIEEELKTRSRSKLRAPLGPLPSAKLEKSEGTVSFPVKGKEVYIFFASWCGHCRQLLETLAREIRDEKLWKKIQLVESLSSSESLFEAQLLCASAKLPKNVCKEILLLPSARRNPEIESALRLTSVPRVVITDPNGNVRDFDFRFEEAPSQDPLRKLRWILD